MMRGHWSDCAVHNEPTEPAAPCDCNGLELSVDDAHTPVVLRIALPGAMGDFLREMHREGFIESHHLPADRLVADTAASDLINAHTWVTGRRNADGMNFDDALETAILETSTNAGLQGGDGDIGQHSTFPFTG